MKRTNILIFALLATLLAGCGMRKPTQLTDFGFRPEWSPNGQQIAFVSETNGEYEIFVMNSDGTNIKKIVSDDFESISLAWSPNGNQIAFSAKPKDDTISNIYVMNSDGTMRQKIHQGGFDPSWSPDGSKITFTNYSIQKNKTISQVYIMNSDGTMKKMLHENGFSPIWSPDGSLIAFNSYSEKIINGSQASGIYFIKPNGSGLISPCGFAKNSLCQSPVWSPDGTKFAYIDMLDYTITVANTDLTNYKDLTFSKLPSGNDGSSISWSPDGKRITFDYWRNDQLVINSKKISTIDIYIMNIDGTGLKQLTKDTYLRSSIPQWSPDGRLIAYTSRDNNGTGIWVIAAR